MKPVYTMDFETDPFEHGNRVYPFACGLFDGRNFTSVWHNPQVPASTRKRNDHREIMSLYKCGDKMVTILNNLPPSIVYMHNGGRFDIFYLMKYLDAEMRIINGRIVQCRLGRHEIRDSFAILPMGLGKMGGKKDIDISKLHRDVREQHRVEILEYLKQDCVGLHKLVTQFRDEFGDYLTIGSAAMNQLKSYHPFERGNAYMDEKFRSRFFIGGRVQCFESGIIKTPFKIYDVNSMYPFVMKHFRHPTGMAYELGRTITKDTAFIEVEGVNRGAFAARNKKGGIDFTGERGTYYCTIHEWNASQDTGTFKATKVLKTFNFDAWISFDEFVDHFFNSKVKFKIAGDKIHEIFYKLILNSAYGKFAQNPNNFFDYAISCREKMPEPWKEHYIHEDGDYVIWKKNVIRHSYYNVAIGASITGAARSVLLRAISKANRPIYCDTDSLICKDLNSVKFSDTALGAWAFEGQGDRLAIAGKKMYACFNGDTCIKQATKGAKLEHAEIVEVAQGKTILYNKPAPTFKLDGRVQFISRNIRRTV